MDKSFQSYLKKQNAQKRVLADDIDKVWQQYERAKDNMHKTFVVLERRRNDAPSNFLENLIPVPIATDEPVVSLMESKINQFVNPYKLLHANLTLTGSLDSALNKKEVQTNTGRIPMLTLPTNERIASADKVSQIPIPMQIKSIMKKSVENESKTQLQISTNDHPSSDPSDVSSNVNVKNVLLTEAVHLCDSKPSDDSIKSKHSEISLNSLRSSRSERFRKGNELIQTENIERTQLSIIGAEASVQAGTVEATQHNADTKEISALFQKIVIENNVTTQSTSSENSDKRNISTGHKSKSTSSDEFWK